jgi:hypothetical protein
MRPLLAALLVSGITSTALAQGAPAPAAATTLQQQGLTTTAPLPSGIDAAPETTPAATPATDWMQYQNHYAGEQNNLANPNKTSEEITAWAQKAVADALSFTPEDLDEKIKAAKNMFIQRGWDEYAAYVRDAQLLDRVRTQKMSMNTILNGGAVIMGSEPINGVYRWLVRAPVMITFLRKEDATGMQKPAGTGKFNLTLQIMRVPQGQGESGIAIESWKVETAQ